jgi:hypothetical protein
MAKQTWYDALACEEAGAIPLAEHLRTPDHSLCCGAVDYILRRR